MRIGIFFSQRAVPPTLQKIYHHDFYFFITITSPIEEVDKDEIHDRRKEHRQGAIVQCGAKACSPGKFLLQVETSCTAQKYSTLVRISSAHLPSVYVGDPCHL